MRFSEVVKKWEDGWRGIAIDGNNKEYTFNDVTFYMPNCYGKVVAEINEYWTIKEEKDSLTLKINATINTESIDDIKKTINELQSKLDNLKININIE